MLQHKVNGGGQMTIASCFYDDENDTTSSKAVTAFTDDDKLLIWEQLILGEGGDRYKPAVQSFVKEMTMNMYHGYYVFLATFFLNFITIGQFNSSSLYLDPLHRSFPESDSGTLALVCTIQIVAALASSLAGGMAQNVLNDYVGLNCSSSEGY